MSDAPPQADPWKDVRFVGATIGNAYLGKADPGGELRMVYLAADVDRALATERQHHAEEIEAERNWRLTQCDVSDFLKKELEAALHEQARLRERLQEWKEREQRRVVALKESGFYGGTVLDGIAWLKARAEAAEQAHAALQQQMDEIDRIIYMPTDAIPHADGRQAFRRGWLTSAAAAAEQHEDEVDRLAALSESHASMKKEIEQACRTALRLDVPRHELIQRIRAALASAPSTTPEQSNG